MIAISRSLFAALTWARRSIEVVGFLGVILLPPPIWGSPPPPPAFRLEGEVIDAKTRQPLANVTVEIYAAARHRHPDPGIWGITYQGQIRPLGEVRTDASGCFRYESKVPGDIDSVEVLVRRHGYVTWRSPRPAIAVESRTPRLEVELVAGVPIRGSLHKPDGSMATSGIVWMQVVSWAGGPLRRVRHALFRIHSKTMGRSRSG